MKILHVTPAYYPATYWGGPIFSVYALNNALARLRKIYNGPVELLKVGSPDLEWMQGVERLGLSDAASCLGFVHLVK